MFITVTGGSGSGKSEMAEGISHAVCDGAKIYAATMQVWDEESRRRIEKHRKQRMGKRFSTWECPMNLEQVVFEENVSLILLECISNLVANELYAGEQFRMKDPEMVTECIIRGIRHFADHAEHLVVVTNEMFQNGTPTGEMGTYLEVTGKINRYLMERSDLVVESVYGIPYFWKKDQRLTMEKGRWVCNSKG